MRNEIIAKAISVYKLSINILRIILGALIIKFNFDIPIGINTITELSKYHPVITYLGGCIKGSSFLLTLILTLTLIIFSIMDLIFILGLINRKRWGAIGLFINSFLWIPVEILFISKFLVAPELIMIILNIIIIYALYHLLKSSKHYFKKDSC